VSQLIPHRRGAARRIAALVAVAMAVLSPGAAGATSPWMDDGRLRTQFGGRTIEGTYTDGTPFTESYFDTGRLDYSEPTRRMVGRWSVVESTFCTLYDGAASGGCFKVRQMSGNCFEFYYAAADEEDLAEAPADRPRWVARGWRKDVPSTCPGVPVV
jgi:hypothetical protein